MVAIPRGWGRILFVFKCIYLGMLMFAPGMYVETVGNILVLSAIVAGIAAALVLRLFRRPPPRSDP